MTRLRTSKIWIFPREQFAALVASSASYSAVARGVGFTGYTGGTLKTIRTRIVEDGLDASHMSGCSHSSGKEIKASKIPLEDVLVEHSTYSRGALKRRLIASGRLKNECSICGLPPVWKGNPLVLRLDHINGVNDDARFDNLRLVCPNCDSQLPTFSGANYKRAKRTNFACAECGKAIGRGAIRCRVCSRKAAFKVVWPSLAELDEMIEKTSRNQVARSLGISWNGLVQHIKAERVTKSGVAV